MKPLNRLGRAAVPLALLLCATGLAQNSTDAQRCEDFQLYRHILTAEPRPNGLLRSENITDEEVREVQRAALDVYPDSIVSISGVTDGCGCEEGSSCTAQVWLALYRENQTHSLALSRIDGHWQVGAVQKWWLLYTAHKTSFPGFGRGTKHLAWQEDNQRLLDGFPACPTAPANWMLLRSESTSATRVDMSSIRVSGFIRRVNFKHVITSPYKLMPTLPKRPAGYPFPRYSISLVAFDCSDHRTRTDELTTYFDDGTARPISVNDAVLWDPIRPDTSSAADLDLVCGWSSK
jgi:hypothetical protein